MNHRQRIGDDETVCVIMTRRQAIILEAWLVGRNARLEPAAEDTPAPVARYELSPRGVELDLRRARF